MTNKAKKKHLPQSEAEWLETELFHIVGVDIGGVPIKCAVTKPAATKRFIVMVGGIPRDPKRRKALPLINKLFGHLALKVLPNNIGSVLYNQPGTGGSGGSWKKQSISSRVEVLKGLVEHFCEMFGAVDCVVIGASAGAYMALRSCNILNDRGIKVSKLILLSPAAYPRRIEAVPYGVDFTKIVRKSWDVRTSPSFRDLSRFILEGGSVLTTYFEEDNPPIPVCIQEHYKNLIRELSGYGKTNFVLTIPGVSHNFRKLIRRPNDSAVDNESIRVTAQRFLEFLTS